MRGRIASFLLASLAGLCLTLTGCQGLAPPTTYVAAHRNTHNQAAHIYTTFESDHPNESDAAKALYDSEEKLIQSAEKANGGSKTPASPGSMVPSDPANSPLRSVPVSTPPPDRPLLRVVAN